MLTKATPLPAKTSAKKHRIMILAAAALNVTVQHAFEFLRGAHATDAGWYRGDDGEWSHHSLPEAAVKNTFVTMKDDKQFDGKPLRLRASSEPTAPELNNLLKNLKNSTALKRGVEEHRTSPGSAPTTGGETSIIASASTTGGTSASSAPTHWYPSVSVAE